MKKLRYIIFLVSLIIGINVVSCDKYDTIVVGQAFAPYNSLVTKFRQLVYVEFRNGDARVWGPCADLVESIIDDSHVTLTSSLDSLVVLAYGYAVNDSVLVSHGNISINSSQPYALYLKDLVLSSEDGPAIQSVGASDCYLVLPAKTLSKVYGSLSFGGSLIIDGEGALNVVADDASAISVSRGITCSYPVAVNLTSRTADGIQAKQGNIKIADGTWIIAASRHAFSTSAGQVILNGGKVYASAETGSIVSSPEGMGLVANATVCVGMSAKKSVVEEVERRQFVWNLQLPDTMSFDADSIVTILRDPNFSGNPIKLTTFAPAYTFHAPWVLVTDSLLTEADDIIFETLP